jgi:hypothetical protein
MGFKRISLLPGQNTFYTQSIFILFQYSNDELPDHASFRLDPLGCQAGGPSRRP